MYSQIRGVATSTPLAVYSFVHVAYIYLALATSFPLLTTINQYNDILLIILASLLTLSLGAFTHIHWWGSAVEHRGI